MLKRLAVPVLAAALMVLFHPSPAAAQFGVYFGGPGYYACPAGPYGYPYPVPLSCFTYYGYPYASPYVYTHPYYRGHDGGYWGYRFRGYGSYGRWGYPGGFRDCHGFVDHGGFGGHGGRR